MSVQYFHVDIESTGTDIESDDILQIAFLQCVYEDSYWKTLKHFEFIEHSDKKPSDRFAVEHLSELYKLANEQVNWQRSVRRGQIIDFFESCGAQANERFLMGKNIASFDIPFLLHDEYLKRGDFHYRLFDVNSALTLAESVTGIEKNILIDIALERAPTPNLPSGKEHHALFDCYRQTRLLNGLIYILRTEGK